MSGKSSSSRSHKCMVKYKSSKVRSSRKVCKEKFACRGEYAIFECRDCSSYQCEECCALLHQHFPLLLHVRTLITGPPAEELCEGTCEDRNFADITCLLCNQNYCYLCDYMLHLQGKQNHQRQKFVSENDDFISCEPIPEGVYADFFNSENININGESSSEEEMMSLDNELSDLPDLFPESEIRAKYNNTRLNRAINHYSFVLINDKEELQIKTAEEFLEKLGSGDKALKVVSIFGNTGDGKSYTFNHMFFDGKELFKTSKSQDACTVGAWAAYCPSLDIIAIDTEGLLGQASNSNRRARMLLKILAVSDVIIYRTRAERLHEDMFSFLGDASSAYSNHFAKELEEASVRYNIKGPLSSLGPAVIIFHETQFNAVLTKDEYGIEPEAYLRTRFQEANLKVDAFCSLEYLGTCSNSGPTDFRHLREKVEAHVQNSSVRVARSPAIIYKVLKVLNDKFNGTLDKTASNTFPDQYFTCSMHCKSCKARCSNSMNHEKDEIPHVSLGNCIYQKQFDNKLLFCKNCHLSGQRVEVTSKLMESTDSSLLGFAKYAWSGYILECPKCGVIYRSREYWYGNKDPWETCVRTETCHVFPQANGLLPNQSNTAQYVIDNITTVSEVVSSLSAKPTKIIKSWVADQIAPTYWKKNSELVQCCICEHKFTTLDPVHHCRNCGDGLCEICFERAPRKVVASWGSDKVPVCNTCSEDGKVPPFHNPPDIQVRKIAEAVHSTLGTVASAAINFPLGIIKKNARPTYWVPDDQLTKCYLCNNPFGPKLFIHHCRCCGEGVCNGCSQGRQPVPARGWTYDVRICKTCEATKAYIS